MKSPPYTSTTKFTNGYNISPCSGSLLRLPRQLLTKYIYRADPSNRPPPESFIPFILLFAHFRKMFLITKLLEAKFWATNIKMGVLEIYTFMQHKNITLRHTYTLLNSCIYVYFIWNKFYYFIPRRTNPPQKLALFASRISLANITFIGSI